VGKDIVYSIQENRNLADGEGHLRRCRSSTMTRIKYATSPASRRLVSARPALAPECELTFAPLLYRSSSWRHGVYYYEQLRAAAERNQAIRSDAVEASLVKQSEATLEAACCPAVSISHRIAISIGVSILRFHKGIFNSSEFAVSSQMRRYLFGQSFPARMNLETKHTWGNRSIDMNPSTCSPQAEKFYQMTNTNIREA